MEAFGNVLAYLVVEIVMLIEGTLAAWVEVTSVDGNITNVALSSSGEAFCLNWSTLIVSFAEAMNNMMAALLTVG